MMEKRVDKYDASARMANLEAAQIAASNGRDKLSPPAREAL
jgi:hypothetical protein